MKTILKRSSLLSISLLVCASTCLAQQPGNGGMPVASPEARRIVDAIAGNWSGHMTASFPGVKPETFAWEVKCKSAALGFGAACT
ncbi:MAG: hypothetical protein ACREDR_22330, partial [Blastocatellia bacterium]